MGKRSRRLGGGLVAAALVVSIAGTGVPANGAPAARLDAPLLAGAPANSGASGRAARSVTLITGDRITVRADGSAARTPGPGRAGIPAMAWRDAGHLHVLPADAAPLVRAGRLDARLFDVTALLEFGYDDRRRDLPLIVSSTGNRTATRTLTEQGARVVRELPAVDGVAVRADKDRLADLWRGVTGGVTTNNLRGGLSAIWLDGLRKPVLDHSVPQIGAPAAWQAGLDGSGVKVAVLDTGIDATHPDLAGQVVGQANFTEGEEDDKDRYGHGTHVASTIAGTGAVSAGKYRGVAPGADLLDGKVCGQRGCQDSWILAGMQWAVQQGAAVVNLSLGAEDTPEVDPVEQAVQSLTEQHGTLFVVAAGNDGDDATINSPASADAALAVGAVDRDDQLAGFSSRGPRTGDGGLKPDITAPGIDIVAANSADGFLGEPGAAYATSSGTSMATPHVVGAAALLAQRHPEWTAAELKPALMASARPNPALSAYAQGAGRVDVARAIDQTVVTDPPSVGFDRQLWPHDDDVPVTETVTFRNHGTESVTLSLSVTATGPDRAPAPAGMFTLDAAELTVPAGGTAEVRLTADTRVAGPDGYYSGRLVATAGDQVIGTPFAVDREVESYDVDLTHLNRAGAVTGSYHTALFPIDGKPTAYYPYDDDGRVTIRLPKGRYTLLSFVNEDDEENPQASLLAQPALSVTGPTTVNVDARAAAPVSITVPNPDVTQLLGVLGAELNLPNHTAMFDLLGDTFTGLFTGQLGHGGLDGFVSKVTGVWAKADDDGVPVPNSPYVYHLTWHAEDTMFTGYTRRVRESELATVRSRYARHTVRGADVETQVVDHPKVPGVFAWSWGTYLPVDAPAERTEYFNVDGGVRWNRAIEEWRRDPTGDPDTSFPETIFHVEEAHAAYRAGSLTRTQWNQGVFGPTLDDPYNPELWVSRTGDELLVTPPMFGDGAGRIGGSTTDTASIVLYRDGVKFAEADELGGVFEVPPAAADYRIEVTATRGAPFVLSTEVSAAWTFRSGHVPGEKPVRLPLSVVRFSPLLDQHNAAPAGRLVAVPVSVRAQPGSAAGRVRSLAVEVSFDDGRTWRSATVAAVGGTGLVFVPHPDRAGFVSLRATARDQAGNTVRQTIIRAYEIKP